MKDGVGTMRNDGEGKWRLDLRLAMDAIPIIDTGAVAAVGSDTR